MSKVEKALRTIAGELRRTEDELADAEYELEKWGFSRTPSERRAARERIERLREELIVCQRAASITGF